MLTTYSDLPTKNPPYRTLRIWDIAPRDASMDEGEHLLGTFINTIHDRQVGINVDSATYVEGGSSFIRFSTPQMALRTLLLLFDDADLSLFSNPRKGNR